MPIYEYQCPSCGRVFEEWVKVSEAHGEEPCPDCGAKSPRLISHTSFLLKGGGWYVTDYGYKKNVHEDSETKTDSASKGTDTQKKDTSQNAAKTQNASTKTKPADTSKTSAASQSAQA